MSESDLLHRPETGTERKRKWWLALFADSDMLARDYVKQHGRLARDVMTRFVISVKADDELGRVADVLERNNIKRVPVIGADGRLIGIITRGDLVRALAGREAPTPAGMIDDVALQKEIFARIEGQPWVNPTYITVMVNDGVAELWGFIGSEAQRQALQVLAREAGAAKVKDHLQIGTGGFKLYNFA